ncbi:hypothetical protein DID88_009528 [Monilinia fructigena]|uniref:Uncharacterized protein n=1 Tax=Monilinia fructigena TaxID=38457 RepID=A0A395INF8_9HELO|nr:hypothetical protein DID88_009528 [Monilinia fructigena]
MLPERQPFFKIEIRSGCYYNSSVGFNVETVTYKNVKFNVWDVVDKIRSDLCGDITSVVLKDLSLEMQDSLLLVFANKQDIAGAMKPPEVTETTQVERFEKTRSGLWSLVVLLVVKV